MQLKGTTVITVTTEEEGDLDQSTVDRTVTVAFAEEETKTAL